MDHINIKTVQVHPLANISMGQMPHRLRRPFDDRGALWVLRGTKIGVEFLEHFHDGC